MARLAAESNSTDSLAYFLSAAFDVHWSFAIRAASDPLLLPHADLIERCVRTTAERIAQKTLPEIEVTRSKLSVIENHQDELLTVVHLEDFRNIRSKVTTILDKTKEGLLKSVIEARIESVYIPNEMRVMVNRYCEQLRSGESAIAARGLVDIKQGSATKISDRAFRMSLVAGILAWAILCWQANKHSRIAAADTVGMFVLGSIFAGPVIFGIAAVIACATRSVADDTITRNTERTRRKNEDIKARSRATLRERLKVIESLAK
jgi:hypothetical protein